MRLFWIRLSWYLKQLLPFTYVSEYGVGYTGTDDYHKEVCVWKMWMGRSYNVRTWKIS